MNHRVRARVNTTLLFLLEAFNRPKQIGAIFPSSSNLSTAMARWLPAEPERYVLELGPGTGAVTQALISQGLRPDRLVAIEKSEKMAEYLGRKFPESHIIAGDALEMDELIRLALPESAVVGAVISSLPLLNFEAATAGWLVNKLRAVLTPGGKLVQYSYHLGKRRERALRPFRRVWSDVVWLNVPPARVTVYEH